MRHGSLFSGIGGFDLASKWMGWTNVFHCEWDKKCQRVLKHHFPNAESFGDITKTDFKKYANRIDIVTGGFPCQPFSVAGKQKGTEDIRHLWPEMLRAIKEIKPTWIVGENVYGIFNWSAGLVFEQVQVDLENEGYEVQAYILPACAVNAPHKRDRVWFVAHYNGNRALVQGRNGGSFANANVGRLKECCPQWFTSRKFTQNYGLASEPGICRGNDGFPNRVDRLRQLGNAIVPQVALQIFKSIEQYEKIVNK